MLAGCLQVDFIDVCRTTKPAASAKDSQKWTAPPSGQPPLSWPWLNDPSWVGAPLLSPGLPATMWAAVALLLALLGGPVAVSAANFDTGPAAHHR